MHKKRMNRNDILQKLTRFLIPQFWKFIKIFNMKIRAVNMCMEDKKPLYTNKKVFST